MVHFVGILQSRDVADPSSAEVYDFTGANGLRPDFDGTINVTQAGIPFSSGMHTLDDISGLNSCGLGALKHLFTGEPVRMLGA